LDGAKMEAGINCQILYEITFCHQSAKKWCYVKMSTFKVLT
jgi:hypothetical protein